MIGQNHKSYLDKVEEHSLTFFLDEIELVLLWKLMWICEWDSERDGEVGVYIYWNWCVNSINVTNNEIKLFKCGFN